MIKQLVKEVAGNLHAGQLHDAARIVVDFAGSRDRVKNDGDATKHLLTFLYSLLEQDDYESGANLLWTSNMFVADCYFTKLVWANIRNNAGIFLQGASSTSKTFAAGVYFFLDWIRDPEFTTVKVIGPSEAHLKDNLFSHLINLHEKAALPMPGVTGDLFIGTNRKNRRGSIIGTVVPLGKKGAGRIQGVKRFPRTTPHPAFGGLSRIRVLIDEAEKVPPGIWDDVDNVFSNTEGAMGLKVVCAYNPQDITSQVAARAEPEKGWENFDVETDEVWTSKRGWTVVRLDAHKSENVIENRTVVPGIVRQESLDALAKSSGGTQSAGYYTFGRGAYPPSGTILAIFPPNLLKQFKAEVIFLDRPRRCGAVDCALEGGDSAIFATGLYGMASGVRYGPSLTKPDGEVVMFRDERQRIRARYLLQVEQMFRLPKGDTYDMVASIKSHAIKLGIDPNWLLLDRTGNGSGIHDILKRDWDEAVRGVNYSESATELKILDEDTQVSKDKYERLYSEIWFALKRWAEFDLVKINPSIDTLRLYPQLTGRRYLTGLRDKAESKRDYKTRMTESPDEADALTLLVHVVRLASGVVPSMKAGNDIYTDDAEPPVIIGCTDRFEDID